MRPLHSVSPTLRARLASLIERVYEFVDDTFYFAVFFGALAAFVAAHLAGLV